MAREREEPQTDPEGERRELAGIYLARGLTPELVDALAEQLSKGNVLTAHALDELGIIEQQARELPDREKRASRFNSRYTYLRRRFADSGNPHQSLWAHPN